MSCLIIQFDVLKATILDSLVSCSLITAMRSLISPVILCRHSLKTPNKNNNNCFSFSTTENLFLLLGDVYFYSSKYGSFFT